MSQVQRNPLQPLTQTGRWIRGLVGVGAALATILASAHSCGLLGDGSSGLAVANLAVHWVGLSPAVDTAFSIGDTLRYVATVTDRRGTALIGAAIGWGTEDSSVAVVDSAGFVVARGPGVTMVTAGAGKKVGRARIVVRPRIARLDFGPDTLARVAEGSARPLQVRAVDARGHPLPLGRPRWRSSDSTIVAVDSAGVVSGRMPGRAFVTAALDAVADSAAVEVVPVPGRLVVLKGDGQRAGVGARLPEPVLVRIESRRGRPMVGVVVHFTVEGGGSTRPDSMVTGSDGVASALWILGDAPGRQRLVVSVAGLDSLAGVEAEADPSAANTRIALVGDAPSGPAGGPAGVPVTVRVTDSLGRVLPGVPVSWSALDGGDIRGHRARTDSLGEAQAEWRLGPRAGTQRARVLVGSGRSVPAFTVTATAVPGAPAKLAVVGEGPHEGIVGAGLKRPLLVRVTDAKGNPVPDAALQLTAESGTLADTALATDSAGRAVVRWTLGEHAGPQKLTIEAPGLARVVVTARARPQAAANLAFLDPPAAAVAGRPLPKPLRVSVTDAYGNPVPDQLVVFRPAAGSVAPARAMTGKDGVASTRWTPGRQAGRQVLKVSVAATGAGEKLELEVAAPAGAGAGGAKGAPRTATAGTRASRVRTTRP